jgi:hypothetical protein
MTNAPIAFVIPSAFSPNAPAMPANITHVDLLSSNSLIFVMVLFPLWLSNYIKNARNGLLALLKYNFL